MAYVKDPQKKAAIKKAFQSFQKSEKGNLKSKATGVFRLKPAKTDLITRGKIGAGPGRPVGSRLFNVVGEFLTVDSIKELPTGMTGVYILFDSSATARYVGLAVDIKKRLGQHMNGKGVADRQKQLFANWFSIYALSDGSYARELESVLIRAIGSSLINGNKNRQLLDLGVKLGVYEPGTLVLESRM